MIKIRKKQIEETKKYVRNKKNQDGKKIKIPNSQNLKPFRRINI